MVPMLRLLLRLAVVVIVIVVLVAALVLTAALTRAQPNEEARLRRLLAPPDGCAMPCWQGIQPGVTTAADALALLRAHPWVDSASYLQGMGLASASVVWEWSADAPPDIDTSRQGVLWIQSTLVKRIDIATTVPYGWFWLHARPTRGALFGGPVQPRRVYHLMNYFGAGLQLRVAFICPVTPWQFWNAPAILLYTDAPIMTFGSYPAPYQQNQPVCRGEGPAVF